MKLKKWYYDAVSNDGHVFIGYAVQLEIFKLKLPWRACYIWHDLEKLQQGFGSFERDSNEQQNVFAVKKYQLMGSWGKSNCTDPKNILDTKRLKIVWQALCTRSQVELVSHNQNIKGMGYTEVLEMTFSQAHLPFKELHWGRFISQNSEKSLIWIQFDGIHSKNLVLDGKQEYEANKMSKETICYGENQLNMSLKKELLHTSISAHLPFWLQKLFGGSIVSGQESKWLSWGELVDEYGVTHEGWVIHEVVKW